MQMNFNMKIPRLKDVIIGEIEEVRESVALSIYHYQSNLINAQSAMATQK